MCWIWAGDKCKLCTSPCIKAIGFSLKMRNNNSKINTEVRKKRWNPCRSSSSQIIMIVWLFKKSPYCVPKTMRIIVEWRKCKTESSSWKNTRTIKIQSIYRQSRMTLNGHKKPLRHCTVLYACACASMHGMHPCDWNMQIYSSKLLSFVCFFFFFVVYLQQTFILLILQAIIYTAGMFCFLHELICAHDTRWFDNRSARKIFIYENDCMREQWTKGKKMQQQKNKSRLFYRLIWLLWRHHKFH